MGFFILLNLNTMKKLLSIAAFLLFLAACKKDNNGGKLSPSCDGSHPTYDASIKAIIDSRCGSASCHPNYTSYSGISSIVQNGQFKRDVLTNQTMPQGSSLTQDQINKIQCWVNDGYPEN